MTDKSVIVQTLICGADVSLSSVSLDKGRLFNVRYSDLPLLGLWWWLTAVTVTLMTAERASMRVTTWIYNLAHPVYIFFINFSFSLCRDFSHKGVGMCWSDTCFLGTGQTGPIQIRHSVLWFLLLSSKRTKKYYKSTINVFVHYIPDLRHSIAC